jgi:hypothetical protein
MNIRNDTFPPVKPELKVGDIVQCHTDLYILMRNTGNTNSELLAFRGFDGICLAAGFKTLDQWKDWMNSNPAYVHYPKSQYQLALERKDEK